MQSDCTNGGDWINPQPGDAKLGPERLQGETYLVRLSSGEDHSTLGTSVRLQGSWFEAIKEAPLSLARGSAYALLSLWCAPRPPFIRRHLFGEEAEKVQRVLCWRTRERKERKKAKIRMQSL